MKTLVTDFNAPRRFDTHDGCITTKFPLYICIYELKYWAGMLWNNDYPGIDLVTCAEVFQLSMAIEEMMDSKSAFWGAYFWMMENFQDPGLWSVLRRLCADALQTVPNSGPLTGAEIEELLSSFV